ncbi:MAG: hypothetical protein J5858_01240 [Lentisphaeria bacterium]|nr:hypothetical protein [Lentisphaeria bacterium]
MKSIVCIYAVGFLLLAGLLWFDWLLLLVPFSPLFLVGFVFAVGFAIRRFWREKSRRARLTGLIPLAIVLAGTVMLFLPHVDWKVHVDHFLFQKQRLQAVEEILRKNPRIEEVGTQFDLPHWWLSSNGRVWIFDPKPERRLVGFPVTTGLLSPCWMVVYSAQDRQPTERELHVGEIRIFKKLSPHWYYLHCR